MPSLTCFKWRFTPQWPMIFLALASIALFVRLGFWQIHRADEKKSMLAAQASLGRQMPKVWHAEQPLPLQYQRIQITGHYLPDVFFLDNQHHEHAFGYDVLSPMQLDNGHIIMIDRGWVKGENTRRIYPAVKTPIDSMVVQGSAYFPSNNQWVLGADLEKIASNVTVIERVDVNLLSQILQKKVYPFIIRLDKEDAYGFVREWAIVSMPPERHVAYAIQWFAIALVILILFISLNLKKEDDKTS